MPLGKRKLAALFSRSTMRAAKRTTVGYSKYAKRMMGRVAARQMIGARPLGIRVRKLERMIESKQFTWRTSPNVALAHNNITICQQQSGGDLNPFRSANSTDEPMGVGGSRIGDQISVKGVLIRAFFENALQRNKVHFRVMVVRCAKGDTPTRATLFKQDSDNKMIDQVNNERYSIVAQKIFNIQSKAGMASTVTATGVPQANSVTDVAAQGTRTFKMWIPGYKFGNGGNLQYENASQTQLKFYDYRIVILAYDWFGTPQDVNNVGKINELYTKVYFKDA